jgi:hypothetical protein
MLSFRLTTPPSVEPVSLALAKQQLKVDFPDEDTLIAGFITAARQWAEVYTKRAFFTQSFQLSLDAFPLFMANNGTLPPSQLRGWPYYSSYWDPLAIRLPRPTCLTVDKITYLDLTNTIQTLDPSTYFVDITSEPARIVPMPSLTWPTTQLYLPGSVQVNYTTGSFVRKKSEEFTLLQSPVLDIDSVVDAEGATPAFTSQDGVLTFQAASAGLSYTVNYDFGDCPQTVVSAILLMVEHLYEHRGTVSELSLKEIPMGSKFLLDTVKFESFTFDNGY